MLRRHQQKTMTGIASYTTLTLQRSTRFLYQLASCTAAPAGMRRKQWIAVRVIIVGQEAGR